MHSWESNRRDADLSNTAGAVVKFAVPTIANGKVYVGMQYGFAVFGELAAGPFRLQTAQATAPRMPAHHAVLTRATAGVSQAIDGMKRKNWV